MMRMPKGSDKLYFVKTTNKIEPKCSEVCEFFFFFCIDPRPNLDSMLTKWRRKNGDESKDVLDKYQKSKQK